MELKDIPSELIFSFDYSIDHLKIELQKLDFGNDWKEGSSKTREWVSYYDGFSIRFFQTTGRLWFRRRKGALQLPEQRKEEILKLYKKILDAPHIFAAWKESRKSILKVTDAKE